MFEFLLSFALLASLSYISNVPSVGSQSGADFLIRYLIVLLAAPLVFAHIIHLADKIFKLTGFKKSTWRDSITAVIVAFSIGAGISSLFLHEYFQYFQEFFTADKELVGPQTLNLS